MNEAYFELRRIVQRDDLIVKVINLIHDIDENKYCVISTEIWRNGFREIELKKNFDETIDVITYFDFENADWKDNINEALYSASFSI